MFQHTHHKHDVGIYIYCKHMQVHVRTRLTEVVVVVATTGVVPTATGVV